VIAPRRFNPTEYAEGKCYSHDLERLRDTGELVELDCQRAHALCDYLVEINSVRGYDPGLYTRRIPELVGHGECIMGIADSYPSHHPLAPPSLLEKIEHLCVNWRWRLKSHTHRLREAHGDFHPWNILFRTGVDFTVLDRSRDEYGDPADDVASLTMNYLSSLYREAGVWKALWVHCSSASGGTISRGPEITKCSAWSRRSWPSAVLSWPVRSGIRLFRPPCGICFSRLPSPYWRANRFDPQKANSYC
jgi:hypothetical protein